MLRSISIIVTIRERYSDSVTSLLSLYEHTPSPFELIYVDVRSPRSVSRQLQHLSEQRGFQYIRVGEYISPNRARNLGFHRSTGQYVVFVDNDVIFTENWLAALVDCADDTGAAAVGPLYLHGPVESEIVHMAGGLTRFQGEDWGRLTFEQTQRYFNQPVRDVPPRDLTRQKSDLIEFHCALFRRTTLDQVGPFDESLLTTREHIDFCLRIQAHGGNIYYEPASRVSYLYPTAFRATDVPYFMVRWSDSWTKATLQSFAAKYGIDPSYEARVAKTRRRRQMLLFSPLEKKLGKFAGPRLCRSVRYGFGLLEPLISEAVVKVAGRHPTGREPS